MQQTQNRAVRIGFDRVANQVIQPCQRLVKSAIMIENRVRAIQLERRPKLLRRDRDIDIFTKQFAIAVVK